MASGGVVLWHSPVFLSVGETGYSCRVSNPSLGETARTGHCSLPLPWRQGFIRFLVFSHVTFYMVSGMEDKMPPISGIFSPVLFS